MIKLPVNVRFEQAVYGSFPFWNRGYAVLAHSAGCRPEWLAELRTACQRCGEPPAGLIPADSLFALRLQCGPVDDRGRPSPGLRRPGPAGCAGVSRTLRGPMGLPVDRCRSVRLRRCPAPRVDRSRPRTTPARAHLDVPPEPGERPRRSPTTTTRDSPRSSAALTRGRRVIVQSSEPIDRLAQQRLARFAAICPPPRDGRHLGVRQRQPVRSGRSPQAGRSRLQSFRLDLRTRKRQVTPDNARIEPGYHPKPSAAVRLAGLVKRPSLLASWSQDSDTRSSPFRTISSISGSVEPVPNETIAACGPGFVASRCSASWRSSSTISGCAGGQQVTPEAIEQAKQLWTKAGIRDYDLEWTVAGGQTNHYYVQVRDGEVRQIESILPDGTADGCSRLPDTSVLQRGRPVPDDRQRAGPAQDRSSIRPAAGDQVVMRFKPDPKLGYPQWYHRDVMGTSLVDRDRCGQTCSARLKLELGITSRWCPAETDMSP